MDRNATRSGLRTGRTPATNRSPHAHARAKRTLTTPRRSPPWLLLALLTSGVLAILGVAVADGAIYLGASPGGPTVFLQVSIDDDMRASVALRVVPGDGYLMPNLDGTGVARLGDGTVTVAAEGAPPWSGAAGDREHAPAVTITVRASSVRAGAGLDPFGRADVTVFLEDRPDPMRLRLDAIGTLYEWRSALADGSLEVVREAPFFYADPWRDLDVVELAYAFARESLAEGIAVRREAPMGVASTWTDETVASVEALSDELASIALWTYTYTGGAHPNTEVSSAALVRGDEGWRAADVCDVLAAVGRACDTDVLRQEIIDALRFQEAAWVTAGDVDASTPWLLDTFVLTATSIRFLYSPYEVGPYVQGTFVVDVALSELAPRGR